jgi:tRNA(fMet)-specific endonuclease VapC
VIRYLLDTNVCIELIRRRSRPVLNRLRQCRIGEVGLSILTEAELAHRVHKSSDPARNTLALMQFLAPLTILPFEGRAAWVYGKIRAQLESAGTPIGPLDTLIAAQALAAEATLVTNNEREFLRVPGLVVENWIRRD